MPKPNKSALELLEEEFKKKAQEAVAKTKAKQEKQKSTNMSVGGSASHKGGKTTKASQSNAKHKTSDTSTKYRNSAYGDTGDSKRYKATDYTKTLDRSTDTSSLSNKKKASAKEDDERTSTKFRKVDEDSFMGRASNVTHGAAEQFAGAQMSSVGTALQKWETDDRSILNGQYIGGQKGKRAYSTRGNDRLTESQAKKKRETAGNSGSKGSRGVGVSINDFTRDYKRNYGENELSQSLINTGDALQESGAKKIEQAKEGLGKGGQILVDLSSNAMMMAGDGLMNLIAPGLGLASLGNRAGGMAAYEGRTEGMNADQQYLYALSTSAIEMLSEQIGNGVSAFRGVYGKGAIDVADSVAQRMATSKIVQNIFRDSPLGQNLAVQLAKFGINAAEEGLEEVIADLAEPAMKYAITKSTGGEYDPTSLKDLLYDFMIGALMTIGGGGADVVRGTAQAMSSPAMMDGVATAETMMAIKNASAQNEGSLANYLATSNQAILNKGGIVTGSQVQRMQQATAEAQMENEQAREMARAESLEAARNRGEIESLKYGGTRAEAYEQMRYDEVMEQNATALAEEVADTMGVLDSSDPTTRSKVIAVARALTGNASTYDIDTILKDSMAKTTYEKMSGMKLSNKMSEARKELETQSNINEIANSNKALQLVWNDDAQEITKQLSENIKGTGKQVFMENLAKGEETLGKANYSRLFDKIYTAGTISGMTVNDAMHMVDSVFAGNPNSQGKEFFNEARVKEIFLAGRADTPDIRTEGKTLKSQKRKSTAKGKVQYGRNVKNSISAPIQAALEKIAENGGITIKVVDRIETNNPNAHANGKYENGVIYLAADSSNPLVTVAKHELTHWIKEHNLDAYKKLEDFIFEEMYKADPDKLQDRINYYTGLYSDLSIQEVKEEIIADMSEAFFTDEGTIKEVVEYNKSLGKTIRDGIKNLFKGFAELGKAQANGRYRGYGEILKDLDILTKAESMWTDALEGSKSVKKSETKAEPKEALTETDKEDLNNHGADVTEGGSVVKYSIESWAEADIEAIKNKLIAAGYEKDEVDAWVANVNSISSVLMANHLSYKESVDRTHSALKDNSEYIYTLDLSTLCAKRKLYQGTLNAIMHSKGMENKVFLPKDVIHLRALMDRMGYEVPCGICYEESRKKNEPKFANNWLNGYKTKDKEWAGYANMEHDDPYVPTLADVLTTDGRSWLRANHPEALESYLTFQKGRGSANPKVSLLHTDYRGEILNLTQNKVNDLNHIGGLRIQSFSDFEIPHVLDMMQAVMDMYAVGLKSQAFTKVPAFAEIFGNTGIKINLSLIGKAVNGELVFDDKEGIDHQRAFELREMYDNNVGTILVGANKESILLAWADDRIDMVIPFHRSGWSKDEFEALGLGDYEDFQKYQAERYILSAKEAEEANRIRAGYKKPPKTKLKAGDTISLTDAKTFKFLESKDELYSADYWDSSLSGTENAKIYLQKCAEMHRRPVFYEFLKDNGDGSWSLKEDGSTDGYWKSLIDFKMYDSNGNFAPQEVVKPNFNMEAADEIINGFEGDPDNLPVAQDVVDQFVKDYLGGRKYKLKDDKPNAKIDLPKVKAKAKNSLTATDSQGNKLSKGQQEFFKDSKVRDDKGNLLVMYHGTENDFYTFDYSQGGKNGTAEGFGIYLASSQEVTKSYGSRQLKTYVNMKRPASSFERTLSRAELKKLVKASVELDANKMLADYNGNLMGAEKDSWISNYANTYEQSLDSAINEVIDKILRFNGNDMDIVQEIMAGMGIRDFDSAVEFYDVLTETTGVDGFLTKWGDESEINRPETPLIAVAFRSSQIKLVDNTNPTKDNDIRYQLTPAEKENEKLKEGIWKKNEQIAAERWRGEVDLEKLRRQHRAAAEAKRARREESEIRTKLLNIARRLDKLKTTQANKELIQSYIGDLDLIAKSMTGKTLDNLWELSEWYREQQELDPFFKDSVIEAKLARVAKKQIADMDINDVRDLLDILKNIENNIRTNNKFVESENRKAVKEAGLEVIKDINNSRGIDTTSTLGKLDTFFINGTLSPIRQIRRITGYKDNDPLYIAAQELADGQRAMFDYQMRAWDMFNKWTSDKKFVDSLNGKKARPIKLMCYQNGQPVTINVTPDIAISLYLSSKNEDNMTHIGNGGVNIPNFEEYRKGNLEKAYANKTKVKFNTAQLQEIEDRLTTKEKAFADTAFEYYNQVAPDAINEVSEILKGYSLARVKNYFPINVDKNFLNKDFESLKFDGTIEGMGSLKERVKSYNPIEINGIVNTLTKSIQENSMYVGLAIPVRNMNKLLGVKDMTWTETDRGGRPDIHVDYNGSVNESIESRWGKPTMKYIEKFMTDLQTSRTKTDDWEKLLNELRSNYAGAVLTLNASVAMKQAASYPTAIAVLGLKPTLRALGNFGKVDLNKIAEYTPLQWYRSQGFSTTELGDIRAGRKDSFVDKLTSMPGLNWIQGMDLATTRKLWKASEYYVRQHNKSLKVGSDAYYEAVADIYNRVIEETQPNYTTMQRPQLLRSDSAWVQMLNMFKTQPYQNFNILYDAYGNYVAKANAYKEDKTIENKAEAKKAYAELGNAALSQLLQLATFAAMTFAWAFVRGKDDKWRDEETGKITLESFMKRLAHDMLSGTFAMFPFGGDIFNLFSKDYYYGYQSVTDASLNDLGNTVKDLISFCSTAYEDLGKWLNGNKEDIDTQELLKLGDTISKEFSRFFGIPYDNVKKTFDAVYRWTMIAANGKYVGEYMAARETLQKDATKKQILYMAYRNDSEQYEALRQMMINDGYDAEKLDSSLNDWRIENMTKEETERYNASLDRIKGTSAWAEATDDERKDYERTLKKYTLNIEDSNTESVQNYAEKNEISFEEAIVGKLNDKRQKEKEEATLNEGLSKLTDTQEWQNLNEKQQQYYKELLDEVLNGDDSARAEAIRSQAVNGKSVEDVMHEAMVREEAAMKVLSPSPLWQGATDNDKDRYELILRKIALGIEDSNTASVTKKATDGLTEEQVILYKLALKKADANNNSNGGYDKNEKMAALQMLMEEYGLTAEQQKILLG